MSRFKGLHFHIVLWCHGKIGIATMQDNIDAFQYQCADLGITTSTDHIEGQPWYQSLMRPPAYNIWIECFNGQLANRAINAVKQGCNLVLICTERAAPGGWNSAGSDPDIKRRWYWYKEVAPHMLAQWCFVPGSAEQLKRFNPNSMDLDLGYSRLREAAVDKVISQVEEYDDPPHDFGFYGGLTDDRREMFEGFRKLGHPVLTKSTGKTHSPGKIDIEDALKHDYGPLLDRNYLAAKCKVILHPSAFAFDPNDKSGKQWGIFSTSRAITALDLRRPVVAEPTRPTIWQNIVEFSPRPGLLSFHDTAMKVLADWKGYRDRQRAKFKELLSPETTLAPVIEQTLLKERRAA